MWEAPAVAARANTILPADHEEPALDSIATPLYAAIFYRESTNPATAKMLLSQRLIHTRVYGQFIAISATIAVMLFGESMKTDGFYVIGPDGRVARSNHVQTTKMRHWCAASTACARASVSVCLACLLV